MELAMRLTSFTAWPSAVAWKPVVYMLPMIASMSLPELKSWPLMTGVSGYRSVGIRTACERTGEGGRRRARADVGGGTGTLRDGAGTTWHTRMRTCIAGSLLMSPA